MRKMRNSPKNQRKNLLLLAARPTFPERICDGGGLNAFRRKVTSAGFASDSPAPSLIIVDVLLSAKLDGLRFEVPLFRDVVATPFRKFVESGCSGWMGGAFRKFGGAGLGNVKDIGVGYCGV